MKRTASIALALACGAALAASVPQTSADKYYFSRPNLPSNIVGKVMGDPPAYHVMRSEDVAWLREAYAERAALMGGVAYTWDGMPQVVTYSPEYGKWPLSESNRFAHCTTAAEPAQGGGLVTNIIVGYAAVTNLGSGVDTARIEEVELWPESSGLCNTNNGTWGYLSTNDGAYVAGARAWRADDPDWTGDGLATNVVEIARLLPAWSNCTALLAMPMTNGTTSVWTNSWSVFAPTNATERVTYVTSRNGGHDLFHLIFTNRTVEGYRAPQPGPLRGPYDSAALTNHYAFLRGLRRLARQPSAADGVRIPVLWHEYTETHDSGYQYDYTYEISETNGVAALPWAEVRCSKGEGKGYSLDSVNWESTTWESKGFLGKYAVGSMTYRLSNPRLAAIPDGASHCVGRARLFARVLVDYDESATAQRQTNTYYGASTSYPPFDVLHYGTNWSWTCVVPVGEVSMFVGEGTNLCFTANMGMDILDAAWSAAGAPGSLPTGLDFPGFRYACPAASHFSDSSGWGEVTGKTEASCHYKAVVDSLLLLIDFAPRASLPGWNN